MAAFEVLRRITAQTGGVIRREEMTSGFEFEGERIPFALRAKGIWKPRQLSGSGAALSITTAVVRRGLRARYDDQLAGIGDWIDYSYQDRDPNNPDNRSVRRALELNRPLIYFYALVSGVFEAIFPAFVVADDFGKRSFRVVADASGLSESSLARGGSEAPLKAYATRTVKERLHQHRFRELVVSAYQVRCAMCRLGHNELLDAAHILPDRDERGRPEVPNGLSLCKIHHGAYDAMILGIDPDCRVHVRVDILEEEDGPMLRHGLQGLEGSRLAIPPSMEDRPNRAYLEERFTNFLSHRVKGRR